MTYIFVDFETRSKADLKTVGARKYFEDPTTEIVVLGFVINDDPVNHWYPGRAFPVLPKGIFVAHNFKFEYYGFQRLIRDGMIKEALAKRLTDLSNWTCTMATAYRCGLPGSLHDLSIALKLQKAKLATGKGLISKYSKPNRKGELIPIPNEDFAAIIEYNAYDIEAMREAFNKLPKLHEDSFEWSIFETDKRLNERGIAIDLKALKILQIAYEREQEQTRREAEKYGLEESGTLSISSPNGLKALLKKHGEKVANAQEKTLNELYTKTKSKEVRKIIDLRRSLQAKAPKKLDRFSELEINGVVYDNIVYHKAITGRWAGYGIQPQNFPRAATKNYKGDLTKAKKGETVDIKKMLRGLLVPRPGNTFIVGDFSSIELVVNAWLSDCQKILSTIRSGKSVYIEFAKLIYRVADIVKGSIEYQTGKTSVLGLGYGMGNKPPYYKFRYTCEKAGIFLPEGLHDEIVSLYRTTYVEIPRFWRDVESAVRRVIITKQTQYVRLIRFDCSGMTMKITLPSGRVMYYFKPSIQNGKITVNGREVWGGDFVAHIVSGTSRDIMSIALIKCEQAGLNPVLTVHDEIVCEVLKKNAKQALVKFKKIMAALPSWCENIPLSAECDIMERYGKL